MIKLKPRQTNKKFAWFLFLWIFVFCTAVSCSENEQSIKQITKTKSENSAWQDRPIPDLTDPSVTTSVFIAVKNSPQYIDKSFLPYANPNAPKGGELSMSAKGSFNSLNPFIDDGIAATGTFYLYDTLMTGSLDEAFVLYPQLAQKVIYDESKKWVIYELNPDARFWDDTPVTAHDVKATFETILQKGRMSWRGLLSGIDGIQVINKHRVIFWFNDDAGADMYANVSLFPVFSKTDIEKNFDKVSLQPLMGSGAYRVGNVDVGRSITYVKNSSYWGENIMVNRGRFNFNRIKFIYYQDDIVAKEAFLAGEFNFYTENNPKNWANFNPRSFNHRITKEAITHQNPVTMEGLVFNIRKPIFADKKLREAISLLFDWNWVNDRLYHGQYKRLDSFFYGSALMATGKPTPKETQILQHLPLNSDEQAVFLGVPETKTTSDGINRADLLKARDILQQAGYYYQNGKLCDKHHRLVSFEILIDDDKYQALLLPFLKNLTKIGINARIRRLDKAVLTHKKRSFDYDMIIDSFMQGNSPGMEQKYLWGSDFADAEGGQNSIGIKSLAVDATIDKLIHSQNRDEIILYSKILDRLLLSGVYIIPFGGQKSTNVLYDNHLVHPNPLPASALGLDYWYYQQNYHD